MLNVSNTVVAPLPIVRPPIASTGHRPDDPWWNPAVEHQATDRAHRIGQTKPVFVYKLIAADTVEERIVELQDKKGRLAAATLDAGAAVGSLAVEDLNYLFGD